MRPLRVAIVGAGPAGLYAAGHLLEGPGGTYLDGSLRRLIDRPVEVDVIDRVATPWGLVRFGVAPDHPEKKLVHSVFDAVAARPGYRYFGNIEVGRDVSTDALAQWYDAVVYATGAAGDSRLGIPGEDLPGSWSAREFVAWYNGHPDQRNLEIDLSGERAVIVGNGNVALDVARILTANPDDLARTDIADHALEALRASRISEVVILGRRGPEHAAFSNSELEELGNLHGVDIVVDSAQIPGIAPDSTTSRKLATLRRYAQRPLRGDGRRIALRFGTSPVEILGEESVRGLRVSDSPEPIDTGLLVRSIGFRGLPLSNLPFDETRGVIAHVDGRVRPGTYVTGWIKRGPRGIIGSNKKCARDTVRALLADAAAGNLPTAGTLDAADVEAQLQARHAQVVGLAGWHRIDDHERRAGRASGRPRTKLTSTEALLAVAHARP